MGDTAHQREPGRRLGLDRHPARRQADAHRGGRSAPRAGRDGGREARPAGRPAHRHRRRGAAPSRQPRQEGHLRRADRRPLLQRPARLEQADRQRALRARQGASRRTHNEYKIVGKPITREDIAPKVFCQEDFVTDIKVPGMVHGRMIRPPVAGAVPVSVDESSIKDIPGAKVVCDKGFLGVVADKEWDAIKAAEKLKVEWSDATPPFPDQSRALRPHPQGAGAQARGRASRSATSMRRSRNAARVIEAEYEWPFQSHACMGPACARGRDARTARSTCWTGSQKPHFCRDGVAAHARRAGRQGARHLDDRPRLLRPQRRRRRRAWTPPCCRKAVGKPVRVQYMRDEGTGWDPKGPASIHRARAAIDAAGKVIAYEFISKGFSRSDVQTNESQPERHAGRPFPRRAAEVRRRSSACRRSPTTSPTSARPWETIAPLLDRASPLRTSHLRDPVGPQIHFASESFMDEVARRARRRSDRVPAAASQGRRATSR